MRSIHRTVLLKETIDGLLAPRSLGEVGNKKVTVLDCTYGGGGHSAEILKRFPDAKIVALDQDESAWKENDKRISFHNENFRDLDKVLDGEKVDGIIFDLGLSSDQLENSGRGFSFLRDEPLLMTMMENPRAEDVTAKEIVNTWSEKSLADIFYGYGEERYGKRIARGIAEAREKTKIKTTAELVEIIRSAVPAIYRRGKIHFATRTFQALRIAVNDELRTLEEGLEKGFVALEKGKRMAVITFHSLEDRIVKNFYKKLKKEERAVLINKKPILAEEEEIKNNPRARSAKLRILEKV